MAKEKKIVIKPEQLDSIQKGVATLAFGLIALIGIQYLAQDLLAPILLAVFIAVLIIPIFNLYRKRNIGRGLSMILTILTFFGGAAAVIIFLVWSFSLLFDSLSVYTEAFVASLNSLTSSVNIPEEATEQITRSINPDSILALVNVVISSLGNIVLYFLIVPRTISPARN